jgi:hypothetical protein
MTFRGTSIRAPNMRSDRVATSQESVHVSYGEARIVLESGCRDERLPCIVDDHNAYA